jgi:predicted cupin superfamily sugar epimerase
VRSDEVWHHYAGQALRLHLLEASDHRTVMLGPDLDAGQQHQFIVPAGCWQAAEVLEPGYALCGCTVAPGFDFEDFEMGTCAGMLAEYPNQRAVIERWIRQ